MRLSQMLPYGALAGVLSAPLLATPVMAQQAAKVTFYGQLTPTYQYVDDGEDSNSNLADNGNSPSRIGMKVVTNLGPGELTFTLESALGLVQTGSYSQTNDPDKLDWTLTSLRKLDFAYTGNFGTISIGQGSTASDGTGEADLSGTGLASYSGVADSAGGFEFRTAAGALSGISLGDVSSNMDGSRRARVRYDTPSFNGFVFSASYGQEVLAEGNDNDYYDLAVRYTKDVGDFTVQAATSYQWVDIADGDTTERYVISAAALHEPTGLNAAVSYGAQTEGGDADYAYVKLGYKARFLNVGGTNFSIDYYQGNDFLTAGDESGSTAFTVLQEFDNQDLEVFASLRRSSYEDTSAVSYQDVDSILIGGRLKF
ncbi:porin [Albibacillus kandeliae]|uniref:porin n=1 Tax=Albibacillus kandeliae TaxID=2174228 RepID=UPI000D69F6ED|nr:porin [Albibacillus kandeliae]